MSTLSLTTAHYQTRCGGCQRERWLALLWSSGNANLILNLHMLVQYWPTEECFFPRKDGGIAPPFHSERGLYGDVCSMASWGCPV